MKDMIKDILRVPGATLSYEVRGRGPLLLLIPGGGNDAHHVYEGLAMCLEDRYSVILYDRRGLSYSQLDDPQEEQRVTVHSDDAHRLLAALGSADEPAYVFASSGGAIVGLDLVARHPEQVRVLIAHEPPTHLTPEHDPIRALGKIRETYLREGIMAAMQQMMGVSGLEANSDEEKMKRREQIDEGQRDMFLRNMVFLFEREFPMYDRYELDFAALQSASALTRIVLAGGADNRADETYWSALAVAERLGSPVADFPGLHRGYATHPTTFAERLHEVLSNAQ